MATLRDRLLPGRLAKIHLISDLLLLWAALGLVTYTNLEAAEAAAGDWVLLGLIMTGAWVLIGLVLRHYGEGPVRYLVEDIAVSSLLTGVSALILAAARMLASNPAAFPPVEPYLLILFGFVVGLRLLVFRPLQARLGPRDEVLIVGVGALARATVRYLCATTPRRRIIGHVMLAEERISGGLRRPLVGRLENLEEILQDNPVDEVYVALDPSVRAQDVAFAVRTCERLGIPFALPLPTLPLERARPTEPMVGGPTTTDGYLHFCPTPTKPYQMAVKRLFDVSSSAAALVILSPLLLGTALAVKLSSPGPVLFKQERVGLHGRRFGMLKFRAMYTDAEARRAALEAANEQEGPVFKIKNDPRITPLGRFIRRFSIDELPQLINVLKGDMSVVGPRPPLPSEVERYEPWQRRRLSVRPGLTCIWQVSGRNEIGFEEWMLLDMRYIDHWGIAADLGLILKTIPVVVTGRGAS